MIRVCFKGLGGAFREINLDFFFFFFPLDFNSSPLICSCLPVSRNYSFCPICVFLFPLPHWKKWSKSELCPRMQQKIGSFLTSTPPRRCFCPPKQRMTTQGQPHTTDVLKSPPNTDVPALQTPSSSTKSECFPGCSLRPRGCFA